MRQVLRTIAVRTAIILVSILAGLVLVEVALRVQQPYLHLMGDQAESGLGRYGAHPIWHHWLRPNSESREPSRDPVHYPDPMVWTVNRQGCRYPRDLTREPARGTRRIIVMGDSFTEGYYQDTTFAAVLERRLNQPGAGSRYEVVNCGTSSYSPLLYYLRYKHQLSKYHPAELILNVDLTDIYDDNYRYGPQAKWDPAGEPLEARPSARGLGAWADNLRYRYHFARLLLGKPHDPLARAVGGNVFAYYTSLSPSSPQWQKEVGVSLGLLQRLIDLTRSQNVELTLTMYPYEEQFQAPPRGALWNRAFEEEVRKLAGRNRVRFYSAYDDIRPYYGHTPLPLYWGNNFHFTPAGQLLWSRLFAEHYVQTRKG